MEAMKPMEEEEEEECRRLLESEQPSDPQLEPSDPQLVLVED